MPGDRLPPITGRLEVTQDAQTISATAEVISLEREADHERLTVADRIALQDAELRRRMADRITRVFVRANVMVLAVFAALVVLDEINIALRLSSPGDRLITGQVLMAMLAATTVQVGTIAAIIARYLFPIRSRDD